MITEQLFTEATGHPPREDELERSNCTQAGEWGHRSCGWCESCNKPRFQCAHLLWKEET